MKSLNNVYEVYLSNYFVADYFPGSLSGNKTDHNNNQSNNLITNNSNNSTNNTNIPIKTNSSNNIQIPSASTISTPLNPVNPNNTTRDASPQITMR
jgi:hypothetical protein